MEYRFIEIVGLILVIGFVGYFFFRTYLKSTNGNYKADLFSERKKTALSVKLLAYERMVLFCDRVNPTKLLVRVKPIDMTTEGYLHLLLKNIEQEFEHNSVQQIYISEECWKVIITVKSAIISKLKQIANTSKDAQELREKMMIAYQTTTPPTDTAIAFIKSEVHKIL
jgi:hypothetical protein